MSTRTITLSILAVVILAAATGWIASEVNRRKFSHLSAYSLDKIDQPAGLTRAEGDATRAFCQNIFHNRWWFRTYRQTLVGPSQQMSVASYCDCMMDRIEERATRLQLLIFVDRLSGNRSGVGYISFDGSDVTRAVAIRGGMTEAKYRSQSDATGALIAQVSDECRKVLLRY